MEVEHKHEVACGREGRGSGSRLAGWGRRHPPGGWPAPQPPSIAGRWHSEGAAGGRLTALHHDDLVALVLARHPRVRRRHKAKGLAAGRVAGASGERAVGWAPGGARTGQLRSGGAACSCATLLPRQPASPAPPSPAPCAQRPARALSRCMMARSNSFMYLYLRNSAFRTMCGRVELGRSAVCRQVVHVLVLEDLCRAGLMGGSTGGRFRRSVRRSDSGVSVPPRCVSEAG